MGSNQSSDNLPDYGTAQRGNNLVGGMNHGSTGQNQSNNMYPLFPEHMTPKSDFSLVMHYGPMSKEPHYGGYSRVQEYLPPKPHPCRPTQEFLWSRDAYGNMQLTPNQLTPYQGMP